MCANEAPIFCVSRTAKRATAPVSVPVVADLAAALRVERRMVEHHLSFLADAQASTTAPSKIRAVTRAEPDSRS